MAARPMLIVRLRILLPRKGTHLRPFAAKPCPARRRLPPGPPYWSN